MSFNRSQLEESKCLSANEQFRNIGLQKLTSNYIIHSYKYNYAYQWTWLGLPIIQLPADIVSTQEIIWKAQPDLIIETGVAWGGSIIMYASLMQLYGKGKVIGIDLNLYDHVADQIMSYPFSDRIQLYKGSSIDMDIVEKVREHIKKGMKVMVLLDSNHTHEHVLNELRLYAPFVSKDQYLIVCSTIVESMPAQLHYSRLYGPGNNPKTALLEYMQECDRFEVDKYFNSKALTTFHPAGYLRCVNEHYAS